METQQKTGLGHLIALLTVIVWGTTFISTKVLLQSFQPVEILFFRFTLGYLALMIAHPRPVRNRSFHEELLFMGAGLCGVTLYFLMENIALVYSLASNVSIILSVAPMLTALVSAVFLKERLHGQFFLGFFTAIAGIGLVVFNGSFLLKLNPLGDVLAALAALVWACYSVLIKKISLLGHSTVGSTRRVFFWGLVFMVPALFGFGFRFGLDRFTHIQNLGNILYLGLGASAVCFATWNWAVKTLGPVKTSAYIYLTPLVTILFSAWILHEPITWAAILGAVLIVAGLSVSEFFQNKNRAGT